MRHVIFFYLIFCFGILSSSAVIFAFFYFKYKLKIVKCYLFLILLFSMRLFLFMHTYYTDTIINTDLFPKIVNVVGRYIWGIFFAIIIPSFYYQLIEKKFPLYAKIVVVAHLLLQGILIASPFIMYTSPEMIYTALKYSYIYINNGIFAFFLIYFFIYSRFYKNDRRSPLANKLLKLNFILGVILVPVLIVDVLENGGIINVLPDGVLLIHVYTAVYSIVHIKKFYDYFFKTVDISAKLGNIPEAFLIRNNITDREKDILKLLLEKCTYRKIADTLFISERTVECHISNIYRKTNVRNKSELIEVMKVFQAIN